MGYQNEKRPEDLDQLWSDISCDLSDLKIDIESRLIWSLTRERILKSLDFIRESFAQLEQRRFEKDR